MNLKSFFHRSRKKYVFMDFDGTVCDARDISFQSFVRVLDEYACRAEKGTVLSLMGTKLEYMLRQVGLSPEHIGSATRKFYRYFEKEAKNGGVKLCVSVKPLWELSKDYRLVLISHSETSYIKSALRKLGIRKLFKKVYGAEKYGTKDELLIKLIKKYKLDPKKTVYIGDRYSDVEYARKAGCVAVAIHNKCSWSDLKTVKKEKPDYIVKDFEGLSSVLKRIRLS